MEYRWQLRIWGLCWHQPCSVFSDNGLGYGYCHSFSSVFILLCWLHIHGQNIFFSQIPSTYPILYGQLNKTNQKPLSDGTNLLDRGIFVVILCNIVPAHSKVHNTCRFRLLPVGVCALLDHSTLVEYSDFIAEFARGQTVRDIDSRFITCDLIEL